MAARRNKHKAPNPRDAPAATQKAQAKCWGYLSAVYNKSKSSYKSLSKASSSPKIKSRVPSKNLNNVINSSYTGTFEKSQTRSSEVTFVHREGATAGQNSRKKEDEDVSVEQKEYATENTKRLEKEIAAKNTLIASTQKSMDALERKQSEFLAKLSKMETSTKQTQQQVTEEKRQSKDIASKLSQAETKILQLEKQLETAKKPKPEPAPKTSSWGFNASSNAKKDMVGRVYGYDY
jgi:predicted RNase H-like nuclease (RuvC/YqgF family)